MLGHRHQFPLGSAAFQFYATITGIRPLPQNIYIHDILLDPEQLSQCLPTAALIQPPHLSTHGHSRPRVLHLTIWTAYPLGLVWSESVVFALKSHLDSHFKFKVFGRSQFRGDKAGVLSRLL